MTDLPTRLLAPGQLDPYTIERCADVAESYIQLDDGDLDDLDDLLDSVVRCDTAEKIAAAIRALGKGQDQK